MGIHYAGCGDLFGKNNQLLAGPKKMTEKNLAYNIYMDHILEVC